MVKERTLMRSMIIDANAIMLVIQPKIVTQVNGDKRLNLVCELWALNISLNR